MSQSAFLEKPAAGPLSSPQPPTVPSPLAATRENTTTGEDTLDSAASSDYGSDFSPDEEELLNLLLARIGADHERATTVVPGSGSPSVFATPALTPLAVSSDPAGAEEGPESGAIGIGYPETIVQLQLQSQSLPRLPLPDIEDYVGISRDRVPRVLGREKWGPIPQRTGRGGRYFGGGRGRANGKGWEWLEAGSGSWGGAFFS